MPRKQNSPSDVKRRQTSKPRSNAASAVRAILQNGDYVAAPAQPAPAAKSSAKKQTVKVDLDVYQVYRDVNGVAYLRVQLGTKEAKFVVNKGFHVELVTIPAKSIRMQYLQPVVGASILECAKRLLQPLNENVTISQSAKEQLISITENEEIITMATKKVAATKKFATVTAPAAKNGAAKKAPKAAATKKPAGAAKGAAPAGRLDEAIITVKAKENTLRDGTFCHAQLAAAMKSNGKTVAHAQKALDASGLNPNNRRIEIAWLTKKGFITTKQA